MRLGLSINDGLPQLPITSQMSNPQFRIYSTKSILLERPDQLIVKGELDCLRTERYTYFSMKDIPLFIYFSHTQSHHHIIPPPQLLYDRTCSYYSNYHILNLFQHAKPLHSWLIKPAQRHYSHVESIM